MTYSILALSLSLIYMYIKKEEMDLSSSHLLAKLLDFKIDFELIRFYLCRMIAIVFMIFLVFKSR